jgi:hypothetical protein
MLRGPCKWWEEPTEAILAEAEIAPTVRLDCRNAFRNMVTAA